MPGTVSSLRPSQALTVKENLLVIEASQLMAAKRGDSVLVVDENDHLSGIFTVNKQIHVIKRTEKNRDRFSGNVLPRGTTMARGRRAIASDFFYRFRPKISLIVLSLGIWILGNELTQERERGVQSVITLYCFKGEIGKKWPKMKT